MWPIQWTTRFGHTFTWKVIDLSAFDISSFFFNTSLSSTFSKVKEKTQTLQNSMPTVIYLGLKLNLIKKNSQLYNKILL